jgi:hypothetical protein
MAAWPHASMQSRNPATGRGGRTVYYITLGRISTGERAQSLVTRQASEEAARAYVQAAIRQSPDADDLWVVDVEARP